MINVFLSSTLTENVDWSLGNEHLQFTLDQPGFIYQLPIEIYNDSLVEYNEMFFLTLELEDPRSGFYPPAYGGSTTVTILDDDGKITELTCHVLMYL